MGVCLPRGFRKAEGAGCNFPGFSAAEGATAAAGWVTKLGFGSLGSRLWPGQAMGEFAAHRHSLPRGGLSVTSAELALGGIASQAPLLSPFLTWKFPVSAA